MDAVTKEALYFLAVGGVRGFAFYLGISTLLDLVCSYFYMHPVVALATRSGLTTDAAGRLLDQPILIVGAMVVGPEFGPIAGFCFAIPAACSRRSCSARSASSASSWQRGSSIC